MPQQQTTTPQSLHNVRFEFRGRSVLLQVSEDAEVLLPTGCGLSLVETLDKTDLVSGRRVLDVGSGTGVYAVLALLAGADSVTSIDINPHCGRALAVNLANNGLGGDGRSRFIPVSLEEFRDDDGFDIVISNPPHLPTLPGLSVPSWLRQALVAGQDGRYLYDVIISRAVDLLKPGGKLLLAHSSLADFPTSVRRLLALGFSCETLSVQRMPIPLPGFAGDRETMFEALAGLRSGGYAQFGDDWFDVHVLCATSPESA